MLSIKPLIHQRITPTTIPLDTVVVRVSPPTVTWLVASRSVDGAYHNTSVYSITAPLATLHSPVTGIQLTMGDTIELWVDEVPSSPPAGIALHFVSATQVDVYAVPDATVPAWQLVYTATPVISAIQEERIYPTCLTHPTSLVNELVLDCRNGQLPISGSLMRLDATKVIIPLPNGTQVGTLDLTSVELFDLASIDRFFYTDDIQTNMFPSSTIGSYCIFHVFTVVGTPYVAIHYGVNYASTSGTLPLTDVTSIPGSATVTSAISPPLTGVETLTTTGGNSIDQQYALLSKVYCKGRADPTLEVAFNLGASASIPGYLVVNIHTVTASTHVDFPGLPTSPSSVAIMLELATSTVNILDAGSSPIGSSPDTNLPNGVVGQYVIKVIPTDTNCLITLYKDNVVVDVASTTALTYQDTRQPLQVDWYLFTGLSAGSVTVEALPSLHKVPTIPIVNKCSLVASAAITPCMDTPTLLAAIDYDDYLSFGNTTATSLPPNGVVTGETGNIDWLVSSASTLSQITTEPFIEEGVGALYLTEYSTLVGKYNLTTPGIAFNCRFYARFTQVVVGDILNVSHTPVPATGFITSVILRVGTGNIWTIHIKYQDQVSGVSNSIQRFLNVPPTVIQPNVTYCVSLSITGTSITLAINGTVYTAQNVTVFSNHMFASGAVPLNQLSATFGYQRDWRLDGVIIQGETAWSTTELIALNNDSSTRSPSFNCDIATLTTDLTPASVDSLPIVTGYGGVVKATSSNSYLVNPGITQVYTIPSFHAWAILGISVAFPGTEGEVSVLTSGVAEAIYHRFIPGDYALNGMTISRGQGVFINSTVSVVVRVTALLG